MPRDIVENNPEVPWKLMSGMREKCYADEVYRDFSILTGKISEKFRKYR